MGIALVLLVFLLLWLGRGQWPWGKGDVQRATPARMTTTQLVNLSTLPRVSHFDDYLQMSVFRGAVFDGGDGNFLMPCEGTAEACAAALGPLTRQIMRFTPLSSTTGMPKFKAMNESKPCARFMAGVSCVVDEVHPHASGSLAHFSKRILPWFFAYTLGHVRCDRFLFPRTPAALEPWFRGVTDLALGTANDSVLGGAVEAPPRLFMEQLRGRTCLGAVRLLYRPHTYFVDEAEALAFKRRAWAHVGLGAPPARPAGDAWRDAWRVCYLTRAPGRRLIRNAFNPSETKAAIAAALRQEARRRGRREPAVTMEDITPTPHTSFEDQVRMFARCDLLASPHGSQNANAIFMRPGSVFLEINPPKFFYFSYEALSRASGLHYVASRRNIALHVTKQPKLQAKFARRIRSFAHLNDTECQDVFACQDAARWIAFDVNLTDLNVQLPAVLRHLGTDDAACRQDPDCARVRRDPPFL